MSTGIAVLPSRSAAAEVDRGADPTNWVYLRPLAGSPGAERIEDSGGFAAHSDGRSPDEREKARLAERANAFRVYVDERL
ncbi:MAG: hypothetical protein GEV03_17610 [Streptosporangiales bacterium]|nr:hypothetical protein [Streptosporangiales bacterium]